MRTRRRGGKPKLKTIVRSRILLGRTLKSHQDCPICLAKLGPQENTTTLNCKHTFHKGCINDWMKSNQTCPMCRRPIDRRFWPVPEPEVPPHARGTEAQFNEMRAGVLDLLIQLTRMEREPFRRRYYHSTVRDVIRRLTGDEQMRVMEAVRPYIERHGIRVTNNQILNFGIDRFF